jgi:hypothetical protein
VRSIVSPARSAGSAVLPSGISSDTYFSPKSVLGTIEPVTSAGTWSISSP